MSCPPSIFLTSTSPPSSSTDTSLFSTTVLPVPGSEHLSPFPEPHLSCYIQRQSFPVIIFFSTGRGDCFLTLPPVFPNPPSTDYFLSC